MILLVVCRVWSEIFQVTVSLQKFYMLLQVIRFDNHDKGTGRRQQNKLPATHVYPTSKRHSGCASGGL